VRQPCSLQGCLTHKKQYVGFDPPPSRSTWDAAATAEAERATSESASPGSIRPSSEHLKVFSGLSPAIQGQNLALIVLFAVQNLALTVQNLALTVLTRRGGGVVPGMQPRRRRQSAPRARALRPGPSESTRPHTPASVSISTDTLLSLWRLKFLRYCKDILVLKFVP